MTRDYSSSNDDEDQEKGEDEDRSPGKGKGRAKTKTKGKKSSKKAETDFVVVSDSDDVDSLEEEADHQRRRRRTHSSSPLFDSPLPFPPARRNERRDSSSSSQHVQQHQQQHQPQQPRLQFQHPDLPPPLSRTSEGLRLRHSLRFVPEDLSSEWDVAPRFQRQASQQAFDPELALSMLKASSLPSTKNPSRTPRTLPLKQLHLHHFRRHQSQKLQQLQHSLQPYLLVRRRSLVASRSSSRQPTRRTSLTTPALRSSASALWDAFGTPEELIRIVLARRRRRRELAKSNDFVGRRRLRAREERRNAGQGRRGGGRRREIWTIGEGFGEEESSRFRGCAG